MFKICLAGASGSNGILFLIISSVIQYPQLLHFAGIPENILNTLTDEQKKRVEAAQSPEELLALAKEAGYKLSPDQLEAVNGGWCPDCGGQCIGYDPNCPVYMIH